LAQKFGEILKFHAKILGKISKNEISAPNLAAKFLKIFKFYKI